MGNKQTDGIKHIEFGGNSKKTSRRIIGALCGITSVGSIILLVMNWHIPLLAPYTATVWVAGYSAGLFLTSKKT